jgi:tetratricopeptide (TPR) repeat protein
VTALVTALSVALALSPAAEASKDLAKGDFERALKRLDGAVSKTQDPSELANLQLLRGQCLLALGKKPKAKEAFLAALAASPSAELDPAKANPEAMELFSAARAELPAPVRISVANGEAMVRLGDKVLGPAPISIELREGSYTIRAYADDGRKAEAELQVTGARKAEVSLELAAAPAPVEAPKAEPVAASEPAAKSEPPKAEPPKAEPSSPSAVSLTRSKPITGLAGWVTLGAGALICVVSGVLWYVTSTYYDKLTSAKGPALTNEQALEYSNTGKALQAASIATMSTGAAMLIAGTVLLIVLPTRSPGLRLSGVVTPGGTAYVSVSGSW